MDNVAQEGRVNQSSVKTSNWRDDKALFSFDPRQGTFFLEARRILLTSSVVGFAGVAQSSGQLLGWIGMSADSNSLFSSPLRVVAGPHTS